MNRSILFSIAIATTAAACGSSETKSASAANSNTSSSSTQAVTTSDTTGSGAGPGAGGERREAGGDPAPRAKANTKCDSQQEGRIMVAEFLLITHHKGLLAPERGPILKRL